MPAARHLARVLLLALAVPVADLPAQTFTLTLPRGAAAARDFASEAIGDPWDFEQAGDFNQAYSLDPADQTRSAWAGRPTIAGGLFTGVSQARVPTLNLQFEGIERAFNLATRNGVRYPIDAATYRRLSMRVRRGAIGSPGVELGGVTWFTGIPRSAATAGGRLFALAGYDGSAGRHLNQMPPDAQGTGWQILVVDLDEAVPLAYGAPWRDRIAGLELRLGDGAHMVGATVDLDWVRLTDRGAAVADLAFAGFGGPVSVSARHVETGDVIRVLPDGGEVTTFEDGTTVRWDFGFLPPGAWVLTAARGGLQRTQTLTIDPRPVIEWLDPDAAGGRDFATTTIGDAWDLANREDVTRHGRLYDIGGATFGPAGLTGITLGPGGDLPNFGDAFVAPLDDAVTFPRERVVGAEEFGRLTFTLEYLNGKELPGPIALTSTWGSIARVVWRGRDGGRGGPYSQTRPIMMLDGGPVTVSVDLRALRTDGPEPAVEPSSPALWTGEIGTLRIDIDEASGVDRPFRLGAVRLAADDEPGASGVFPIRWRVADATFSREVASAQGADATIDLAYDTDTDPASGLVTIARGLPASAGSHAWDTTGLPAGLYFVRATVTDRAGGSHAVYSTGPLRVRGVGTPPRDTDGDGMPDAWEAPYGDLAPEGDEEADGVTNLDEYRGGTDPLLPNRWVLSEGATGFFTERLALANPAPDPAHLTITYLREGAPPIAADYTVAGRSRATVAVNDIPGLADAAVSAVIDVRAGGVVAERTMFWGSGRYGGHTGKALARSRTEWFLAEGEASFFDTYILLANPNDAATDVLVTFLLEGGAAPIPHALSVGPRARLTLDARQVPGVAGRSFSATVASTRPITVERAMYFSTPGRFWAGGHATAAVAAPAAAWFVAEGRTGALFDMYLLLANPASAATAAEIRYLLPGGGVVPQRLTLPPRSRTTIWVDAIAGLEDTDVSASITADRPIIVERAMYWPGPFTAWEEAHASAGLTTTGTRWVLAEGEQGGSLAFDTYLLIANPGATAARVTVTLLRAGGLPPVSRQIEVPANARATLNAGQFGLADAERFGAIVEVTNQVPVVVERAMYWNGGGRFWGGGTNESGVRLR